MADSLGSPISSTANHKVSYRLTVSYDGTPFSGWQRQLNTVTVQGVLEKALERLWGEPIHAEASGRTDTGVHALGQVVSVMAPPKYSGTTLLRALNANLPFTIRVLQAKICRAEFHARFDARAKTYEYRIYPHPIVSPFLINRCWQVTRPLNLRLMRQGAKILTGRHDFAAFASNPGYPLKSTTRTLFRLRLIESDPCLLIQVTASGFLYRMVRNLTGALVRIGEGRLSLKELREILKNKSRSLAPPSAPAYGLFLKQVHYGKPYPPQRDSQREIEE